mgnify:CR=1 FL=1
MGKRNCQSRSKNGYDNDYDNDYDNFNYNGSNIDRNLEFYRKKASFFCRYDRIFGIGINISLSVIPYLF